jgi:preprotein translocase subunit SecD
MLFFATWKKWTINVVCALGVLLSIPAFFNKPSWLPGEALWRSVNLGLDLRGGAYLLLEVDVQTIVRDRLTNLVDSVRTSLRGTDIAYSGLVARGQSVQLQLRDSQKSAEAIKKLQELAQPVTSGALGTSTPDLNVTATPEGLLTLALSEQASRDKATQAIQQVIEILRRRFDELGLKEVYLSRHGEQRVLVQIPGIGNIDREKEIIKRTAKMTFHLTGQASDCIDGSRPPPGIRCMQEEDRAARGARVIPVRQKIEVDGSRLTDARASTSSQTGEWVVNFRFDSLGTRQFCDISRANVGQPFAIVLDGKVITAPTIREAICGGSGQISGSFNSQSASDLAVLLRAGALPAPLSIVEERTVGPDLGKDAIDAGIVSLIVGAILVIVFIVWSYGLFGVFACVGLAINLALTLAILNLLGATLTLPGMAGVLLTLGLSVDANILINERIREETRLGKTPFAAMEAGFTRAFSTIVDANLTTIIKMVLLYSLGSGPVKGFAVTITFGIITSMFTATVLVRLMMVTWLRTRKRESIPV